MPENEKEDREEKIQIIREIIEGVASIIGEKTSYIAVRKSSIKVKGQRKIEDYYGDFETAINILLQNYVKIVGKEVTEQVVREVEEDTERDLDPDIEEIAEAASA